MVAIRDSRVVVKGLKDNKGVFTVRDQQGSSEQGGSTVTRLLAWVAIEQVLILP